MTAETFARAEFEVRTVERGVAADLVATHHYAKGGPNTAVLCSGLFRKGAADCLGVAWRLPPTKVAAQSVCSPTDDWRRVIALCRMAIVPNVPKNAASFLLSRSCRALKQSGRWDIALTYADERVGHSGGVYKAAGWTYLGRTKGDYAWTDSTGRQVAKKATTSRTTAEMLALGLTRSGPWPKHKYVRRLVA